MYYVTIVITWHAIGYFRAATDRELRAAQLQTKLAQVQLSELQDQPLVENAVEHGVAQREGGSRLLIRTGSKTAGSRSKSGTMDPVSSLDASRRGSVLTQPTPGLG